MSGVNQFVLSLENSEAMDKERTGGKGANLARLLQEGFDVPSGFCLTAAVYQLVADDPDIQSDIEALDGLDADDSQRISQVSEDLRSKIRQSKLPEEARQAISDRLEGLESDSYAVRSSATAEDLPSESFAGQYETFLGVSREEVIDSVLECMASLFTERAVSYRLRNDISNTEVEMAVVVQEMADPEAAGVLFTADPVTCNRNIASIDASFGLGDTIVSGEVSPDNIRVDRGTGQILGYEVGSKGQILQTEEGGGTAVTDVSEEKRDSPALSEEQIQSLVELGERVEELFDQPQDVEWALVDGDFVLLQSRPITSLYPIPSRDSKDDSLRVYYSLGHHEVMPEAMPPLVLDFWKELLNNNVARFENQSDAELAVEAGNRVYIDLLPFLRIRSLHRLLPSGIADWNQPAADSLKRFLEQRQDEIPVRSRLKELQLVGSRVLRAVPMFVTVAPGMIARFFRALLSGTDLERERTWWEEEGQELAEKITRPDSDEERVQTAFGGINLIGELPPMTSRYMPFYSSVVAGELLTFILPEADGEMESLDKGLENELVSQINQRMNRIASIARQYTDVENAVGEGAEISEIEELEGGQEFVDAFEDFIEDFGHRTGNEMDLSRPRWKDDPDKVMQTIRKNIVQGRVGEHRDRLDRLEEEAEEALERLEEIAGRGLLGRVRRPIVRRLIRVYRGGLQLREYPRHALAYFYSSVRDVFSEAGESLAEAGQLESPGDIWYLRKDELLAALGEDADIDVDIESRRQVHERYASMEAPPVITSEGEDLTAKAGAETPEGALTGTPVSPGVVEGVVRVVEDPAGASLEEGEILVAPSTDPGWTPLFMDAAGLVMEVGGRMTHGAIVAREYGMPAVASVKDALSEIETGDRIRVDGSEGTVEILG